MVRIWEVTFRENYSSDVIRDTEKVTARTAVEALKKAKPPIPDYVVTDVRLIAQAR